MFPGLISENVFKRPKHESDTHDVSDQEGDPIRKFVEAGRASDQFENETKRRNPESPYLLNSSIVADQIVPQVIGRIVQSNVPVKKSIGLPPKCRGPLRIARRRIPSPKFWYQTGRVSQN